MAGTIPSSSSAPSVATAATPIAPAATANARGTPRTRRAEVMAANAAIPASSNTTAPRLSRPKT